MSAQELTILGSQSSPARTVMLLAGALLCLSVAAWPFIANRDKRTSEAQTDGRRLSIAALVSAAAFVAAIWLPGKAPTAVLPTVSLPRAGAVGPGTAIAVTYADGSGGMSCTAGFLVRTRTGQPGMLTAGHCNKPAEASRVYVNFSGSFVTVGTFRETVSEGLTGEAHDIGLIMLDSDKVPRTSAITESMAVSGVTTDLRIGQQLCKFGMKTGQAQCGRITDVTDSKVVFLAGSQCGDSGGPVYLVLNDGTAAAVGIHIRAGRANDPNPGCSTPATFSVAELVQPWLDKWSLTAVTQSGPPSRR